MAFLSSVVNSLPDFLYTYFVSGIALKTIKAKGIGMDRTVTILTKFNVS